MRVCVQGLWHLGSVTAACLASVGHEVVGLESDQIVVSSLNEGKAPLYERYGNRMQGCRGSVGDF